MAYEKQVWNDDVTGFTSITPAMLNHMEEGIAAAHEVCDSISQIEIARVPKISIGLNSTGNFVAQAYTDSEIVGIGWSPSSKRIFGFSGPNGSNQTWI